MEKFWIVGTGFSRGIGLELAREIKIRGYSLFHIGRQRCNFEDEFISLDLSCPPSKEFFNQFHSKLQNKNIFGFFYSAGLFPALTYEDSNTKQKMDFWESQAKTMQVNYLSCAALVEEIHPYILKSPQKKSETNIIPFIGHFSSLAAVDPLPAFEFYGITKAAALKYFEDFAKRFDSKSLHSFSIHPGTVQTDMVTGIMNRKEHQHLPIIKIFQNALEAKQLLSPKQSAELTASFLFQEKYSEMRELAHGKLYLADVNQIFMPSKN